MDMDDHESTSYPEWIMLMARASRFSSRDDIEVKSMNVIVRTPEGKEISISMKVSKYSSLSDIKREISSKENIISWQQELFLAGKRLKDNLSLFDSAISDGTVLDLVLGQCGEDVVLYVCVNGRVLSLTASLLSTIKDLKLIIEEQAGKLIGPQRLFFDDVELEDDHKTLKEYKIQSESMLHMLRLGEMLIFVKIPKGKMAQFIVGERTSILELKHKIQEKEQVPINQQSIVFTNRCLDDRCTLRECNVHPRSVLLLQTPGFIQIYVSMSDGRIVTLDVDISTKILKVKELIHKKVPKKTSKVSKYQLFLEGELLEDEYILAYYGVQNFSTLHILLGEELVVFIKPLKEAIFTQLIPPTPFLSSEKITVQSLISQIQKRTGIPVIQQRLVFGNQELETSRELSYYKIRAGAKIHLLQQGEMMIFVASSSGPTMLLEVTQTSTVDVVKGDINKNITDLPTDQQRLFYSSYELESKSTLSYYSVPCGSQLYVLRPDEVHVYLHMPSGILSSYFFKLQSTIQENKSTFTQSKKPQICLQQQQLMFAGKKLEDDVSVVKYGIRNESVLHLAHALQSRMELFVTLSSGQKLTLNVELSNTISQVKKKIVAEIGIVQSDHQLFFSRCQLEESWSLADYNIMEKASLYFLKPKELLLFIKTRKSTREEEIVVVATSDDTVGQLEYRMPTLHECASLYQVSIAFNGNILETTAKLSDYNIVTGSTLYVLQTNEFLIDVQTHMTKSFPLIVSSSTTIGEVKCLIQDCESLHPDQQRLIFNENSLYNSNQTLSDCKVESGSKILLLQRKDSGLACELFVYVTVGPERKVCLVVNPSDTVHDIKRQIAVLEDVAPDSQWLTHNCAILKDGSVINDYPKIKDGSLLSVAYKLPLMSSIAVKLNIMVKTPSRRIIPISVKPSITVKGLKQLISEKIVKISPRQQKMFLGSVELEDSHYLMEYGIQMDPVVYILKCGEVILLANYQDSTQEAITVVVNSTSSIREVKTMIQQKLGARGSHYQQLTFCNQILQDKCTLLDCNIGNLSTLFLLKKGNVFLYVQPVSGETKTMTCALSMTVKDLKVKLSVCHPTQLVFSGKQLKDHHTLSHYRIQNESVIHVIVIQSVLNVSVRTPNSDTSIDLEIAALSTVLELKKKIHNVDPEHTPVDHQELFLCDEYLENNYTLCDCGVRSGSTLQLQCVKPSKAIVTINDKHTKVFHLVVPYSTSIHDIKTRIASIACVPVKDQWLYVSGKYVILEDNSTLESNNLKKVSKLDLVSHCARQGFQIFVKTLTKESIHLVVYPWNTVNEVCRKIKDQYELSVAPHQLTFANQQLEGHKRMGQYKIFKECTLYMLKPGDMLITVIFAGQGKDLSIMTTESSTVLEVKAKIKELFSIPPSQQRLFLTKMGTELKDDLRVSRYGIKRGSSLVLIRGKKEGMHIMIKCTRGSVKVPVEQSQSIFDVKKMIQNYTDIPLHEQRLIYASQQLENHHSLATYNVTSGCEIHVLKPTEMLIYVQKTTHGSDMFPLIVTPSTAIQDVLVKVLKREWRMYNMRNFSDSMPPNPKLVYNKETLNVERTMLECHIKSGAVLFLVSGLPVIDIIVSLSNGDEIKLEAEYTERVKNLKTRIAEKAGIPQDQQQVFFAAQELEDEQNLLECHVQAGSILNVVQPNEVLLVVKTSHASFLHVLNVASKVFEIKNDFEKVLNISSDLQKLILDGNVLRDNNSLRDYNVMNGTLLHAIMGSANPGMLIYIQTSSRKRFALQVSGSKTIHDIRLMIVDQPEGIPLEKQGCLMFEDCELQDDQTVSDYNIEKKSTLFLLCNAQQEDAADLVEDVEESLSPIETTTLSQQSSTSLEPSCNTQEISGHCEQTEQMLSFPDEEQQFLLPTDCTISTEVEYEADGTKEASDLPQCVERGELVGDYTDNNDQPLLMNDDQEAVEYKSNIDENSAISEVNQQGTIEPFNSDGRRLDSSLGSMAIKTKDDPCASFEVVNEHSHLPIHLEQCALQEQPISQIEEQGGCGSPAIVNEIMSVTEHTSSTVFSEECTIQDATVIEHEPHKYGKVSFTDEQVLPLKSTTDSFPNQEEYYLTSATSVQTQIDQERELTTTEDDLDVNHPTIETVVPHSTNKDNDPLDTAIQCPSAQGEQPSEKTFDSLESSDSQSNDPDSFDQYSVSIIEGLTRKTVVEKRISESNLEKVLPNADQETFVVAESHQHVDSCVPKSSTMRNGTKFWCNNVLVVCTLIIGAVAIGVMLLIGGGNHTPSAHMDTYNGPSSDLKDGACYEIKTRKEKNDLHRELSKVGSWEKLCVYLSVEEKDCNLLRSSPLEESTKMDRVIAFYLEQTRKPCWEEIIRVLCNDLHKIKQAVNLASRYNLDYTLLCTESE